jgi:hypothetical protein
MNRSLVFDLATEATANLIAKHEGALFGPPGSGKSNNRSCHDTFDTVTCR